MALYVYLVEHILHYHLVRQTFSTPGQQSLNVVATTTPRWPEEAPGEEGGFVR